MVYKLGDSYAPLCRRSASPAPPEAHKNDPDIGGNALDNRVTSGLRSGQTRTRIWDQGIMSGVEWPRMERSSSSSLGTAELAQDGTAELGTRFGTRISTVQSYG